MQKHFKFVLILEKIDQSHYGLELQSEAKIEKILEGYLDLIPSPLPSVNRKIRKSGVQILALEG